MQIFTCVRPKTEILANYDRSEDVLYVNFLSSAPQKADFGTKLGDYIVRLKKNEIVGVTVLNALEHFQKRFSDIPEIILAEECV